MYKLVIAKDNQFDIGLLQGGTFQAYRYPSLGVHTTADWQYLLRMNIDPAMNKFRNPAKILDPNNSLYSLADMIALLQTAVMIDHPTIK